LTIATSEVEGCTVVTVAGELDIHTAPSLQSAISELIDHGVHDLVVDLSQVDFIDSTGLGVLVAGLKKARALHGSLELVCHQDRLLKVFRITGLLDDFAIHESLEAALAGR
jgi:anti-sigma B factor antagonist